MSHDREPPSTQIAVRRIDERHGEYPPQLAAVPDPPRVLHVRGRLVADDALAVAVVGSRRATPYGLEVASSLAAGLAARGVTIVSGLARGVDGAAHRGALAAGGRTIAVLGSGVDVIYPPEHRELATDIVGSGALVSALDPGTPPLAQHFPARNRIIAGLALGVVVVEAAERSGSLITARWAAELGREVMAVPGRITSAESRGAHGLIQDGAALVTSWQDVVDQLPERWRRCVMAGPAPLQSHARAGDAGRPADPERDRLLGALADDAMTMDDVIERTGIASGRAAALLLDLELEGRVRRLAGQRFVRTLRA